MSYLMSILLLAIGAMMLIPLCIALFYEEPYAPFVCGLVCNVSLGIGLRFLSRSRRTDIADLEEADTFVFVGLTWLLIPIVSCVPYIQSGIYGSISNALFESVSGFTATGWSTLTDLDRQPRSILFYRSLSQWIGGMGLTLLLILLLKNMGKGANQLYNSEFRGPEKNKIHPHIATTVKRVYMIYISLTLLQFILLSVGDMPCFDALCYTLSTVSSGGFGLHDNGVAKLSTYSHYILIIFMFVSSINYMLIYWMLRWQPSHWKKDEQLRNFLLLTLGLALILGGYFFLSGKYGWETSLRYGLFQISSFLSSTGFVLDYSISYPLVFAFLFFVLMFVGSNSGTTSSGLKLIRIVLLLKFIHTGTVRIFHKGAIVPVKYNGTVVRDTVINKIFGFVFLYIAIFSTGAFLLLCSKHTFYEAMVLSASALGNVGPVAGTFYPFVSVEQMDVFSQGVMMLLMIIGRVEIYSFLAVFLFRRMR